MFLLFDIGATKMRLAVSKDGKSFGVPKILKTPKDFNEAVGLFKTEAFNLCEGRKIKAAAGGVKGVLDKGKNRLVAVPILTDWTHKPLKENLSKILRVPVFLENDTALVGLGEAVYGAGKGYGVVVYITISTGVGGVIIVGGEIDENTMGFEPGHQIINFDGPPCFFCGVPGHLEEYISGAAFERRYAKKPYEITDPAIWDEAAKFLAYGLNNTIVHWSPDIVVLGGSMMKEIGIPIERVRFYLKNILKIFPEPPLIEKASLGDIGGLYGALTFLKKQLR